MKKRILTLTIVTTLTAVVQLTHASPKNFRQAKILTKEHVYFDRTKQGTIYCSCNWSWAGESGGRVDHKSCGYQVRAIPNRAIRIEYEHVTPISHVAHQRQCWKSGGRKNCNKVDPVFNYIEADIHNLDIAVGEVNADRSAYRFGLLPNAPAQHGMCESRVDFKQRVFEPRDEVKGMVARINFYMHDAYDLKMSTQQQRLFMAWDKQFPVTSWELERDKRIAKVMGHSNEFVTGHKTWNINHKNTGAGLARVNALLSNDQSYSPRGSVTAPAQKGTIINANKNSKIYHLHHCPNYNSVNPKNVIQFSSEPEAQAAGFRKARNC